MNTRKFFGNYRIATNPDGTPVELARESSVVTYKGEHVATREPVTLMLIPQEAVEPSSREAFQTELEAAQVLDHPNIAAVRQFQADDELFVCASEYYDGETLQSWVDQHGPMPADTALRIGSQIASALAAAAFRSVPHGALKPSNIMIVPGTTPAGEWPLVKVLNFGLSKVRPHLLGSRESAGAPLAPGFTSPEHLVQGEVDFRSDVYSLGATLWFLVSGAEPLSASAVESSSGVNKAFRTLIAQMLSVSPSERPQDPLVLEEQLGDCLEQVERRQAIANKIGLPVIAAAAANVGPATAEAARRFEMPALPFSRKALAIAALLLTVAVIGAMMLPRVNSVATDEPLGVPIGVPMAEQTTTAPAVAQTQPVAPAVEPADEEPAPVAPQETTTTTNAEPQIASRTSAAPATDEPASAAPAARATTTPSEPTRVLARNTVPATSVEPEPAAPAEGIAVIDTPPPPTEEPVFVEAAPAASRRSASEDTSSGSEVAASQSTSAPAASPAATQRRTASNSTTTTASRGRSAATTRAPQRTASRDNLPVRRALPPDDDEANLPTLPRGSKRARYLGTDESGAMVFGLPGSEEPVYAAPPASDVRRISPRQRLRRALFGREQEVRPAEPVDDFYEDE